MPTYTYRNTETGEEWTEIRKISESKDGIDGVKIIQVIGTPRMTDPSLSTKRAQDFYDKVIAPKKKFYKDLV
jgi:hypothetical protein